MRWSMLEGAVSDFERWWWFDQSDVRWRACVVTIRSLNRYKVIEIWWLSGIESFVRGMILYSIRSETLSQWRYFRMRVICRDFETWRSSSKSILDEFETIYLIFRKTIVQRVTVVKLEVYDWGGNCFGVVKVEVWTNTAKSPNVMIAGFRRCRDLIGEWQTFIKYEAKVASRLSSVYSWCPVDRSRYSQTSI